MEWIERLSKAGFTIPTIIHPFSYVSEISNIGEGTIIMAGAVVHVNAVIGKGCIINTSSSVDHDCIFRGWRAYISRCSYRGFRKHRKIHMGLYWLMYCKIILKLVEM